MKIVNDRKMMKRMTTRGIIDDSRQVENELEGTTEVMTIQGFKMFQNRNIVG